MRALVQAVAILSIAAALAQAAVHADAAIETSPGGSNKESRIIKVDGLPERVVPLAGGQRAITFGFMAMDPNGWEDIVRAEVVLFAPDNETFLREANVTSVKGGDGASQWFNATFVMWYYELPTVGENYTLRIRTVDQAGVWGHPRFAEFEYAELSAIMIVTTTSTSGSTSTQENETEAEGLAFDEAAPGNQSTITEAVVQNTGNVPVDIAISGTDLVSEQGHTITVHAVRFALDATLADLENLTYESRVIEDFDLMPGEDSARSVYWRLDVPSGHDRYMPAGTYQGSLTITAVAS